MDCLIGAMMKLGGDRRRLVAKVFGGAHVLDVRESATGVPQQNIEFIRRFLSVEGLAILSEDVGGYHPRQVHFFSATNRVLVKRVTRVTQQSRVMTREQHRRESDQPRLGDVTLFE